MRCCAHLEWSPNQSFELFVARKFPEQGPYQVAPLWANVDLGAMRVRGNTIVSPSYSPPQRMQFNVIPRTLQKHSLIFIVCASQLLLLIAVQDLPPVLYSPIESVSLNVARNLNKVHFWMWSVISGGTRNLEQRETLAVFFILQGWCGDLPPAEEKKCLADSTGLLSLLEMLLKQHEGQCLWL